jgi:hypothetical protein
VLGLDVPWLLQQLADEVIGSRSLVAASAHVWLWHKGALPAPNFVSPLFEVKRLYAGRSQMVSRMNEDPDHAKGCLGHA